MFKLSDDKKFSYRTPTVVRVCVTGIIGRHRRRLRLMHLLISFRMGAATPYVSLPRNESIKRARSPYLLLISAWKLPCLHMRLH